VNEMPDLFANDLFEICGTHIQISTIKDYRLGQIEFIKRPVYYERSRSKWGGLFKGSNNHNIEFGGMQYYGAVIGEIKYKNAIEEAPVNNIIDAAAKAVLGGISDAIANLQKNRIVKSIRYRIMNPAWRVFERTLEEIPAVLVREDGKESEVYKQDELYPLLGEPIAPSIEMVPALYIVSTDGNYVFFGNGIQINNIQQEYERLNLAIKEIKEIKDQQSQKQGLLGGVFGIKLPQPPKINIPFLSPTDNQKVLERAKIETEEKS